MELRRRIKDSFPSELASFCSRNKELVVIGGDFNIIIFPSEKNKPMAIGRFINYFNCLISTYELIDINLMKGKFTWSDNQPNPTLQRLDKFLVSND